MITQKNKKVVEVVDFQKLIKDALFKHPDWLENDIVINYVNGIPTAENEPEKIENLKKAEILLEKSKIESKLEVINKEVKKIKFTRKTKRNIMRFEDENFEQKSEIFSKMFIAKFPKFKKEKIGNCIVKIVKMYNEGLRVTVYKNGKRVFTESEWKKQMSFSRIEERVNKHK